MASAQFDKCRGARKRGVTLVELLVVIVVLGAMAGFAGLAWQPLSRASANSTDVSAIQAARRRSLDSGVPVTTEVIAGHQTMKVTTLPDGRVLGGEAVGFDPLTGAPAVERDSTQR